MWEGAILAFGLVGLSFLFMVVQDRWIKTRLWRTLLWWKVPRMDVRSEERAWELVADVALDMIDVLFLEGKICSGTRDVMLNKLKHSPGLGKQFSPTGIQRTLREVISGRIGTHKPIRFPDPGPYIFAYCTTLGDRSKPTTTVLLTMRTGKWRTKGQ